MSSEITLQGVYNKVMAGDCVSLAFSTSAEYNSFRIMLLKKFNNWKNLVEAIGAHNSHEQKYLSAELERQVPDGYPPELHKHCGGIGKFKLTEKKNKKNVRKTYVLADLLGPDGKSKDAADS